MSNENERAAEGFKQRLQKLHQEGDRILGEKVRLVKSDEEICDSLQSLLVEWKALRRQAFDEGQAAILDELLSIVERIVNRAIRLRRDWEVLEEGRRDILQLRMSFDRQHLDRIGAGRSKSEAPDIPPLSRLTKDHDALKDKTAEYFKAAYEGLTSDKEDLERLASFNLDQFSPDTAKTIRHLLGRLEEDVEHRHLWVDLVDVQYRLDVYNLDQKYRLVRSDMEKWEPLS